MRFDCDLGPPWFGDGEECQQVLLVVGPIYIMMSVFYCCIGILEGQTRAIMITVPLVVGTFISVPAAWALGTKTSLELTGIWLGVACGYFFIVVNLLVGVLRSDWVAIAHAAAKRSESKRTEAHSDSDGDKRQRPSSAIQAT